MVCCAWGWIVGRSGMVNYTISGRCEIRWFFRSKCQIVSWLFRVQTSWHGKDGGEGGVWHLKVYQFRKIISNYSETVPRKAGMVPLFFFSRSIPKHHRADAKSKAIKLLINKRHETETLTHFCRKLVLQKSQESKEPPPKYHPTQVTRPYEGVINYHH